MGFDCCIASAASFHAVFLFLRLLALVQFVASSHDSRLRVHWRRLRAAIEWSTVVRLMRLPRGLKRLQIDVVVVYFIVNRSGEAVSSEANAYSWQEVLSNAW